MRGIARFSSFPGSRCIFIVVPIYIIIIATASSWNGDALIGRRGLPSSDEIVGRGYWTVKSTIGNGPSTDIYHIRPRGTSITVFAIATVELNIVVQRQAIPAIQQSIVIGS